ncbi:MAG: substrate-binding domain-containing protein, partial [Acholeplasmataceae bacterium]|nr:substrate-binding domain-containing protein [Acholeplasmataceae bacterium]
YKDFAYLSGPTDAFNNNHRYDGFLQALKEADLSNHQYYQGDFTIQGGYQIGQSILALEEKPRFIFCANDESAIGLMTALKEGHIRIPEDIAISGFDNIVLGEYTTPKLTTIGIDHVAWGKRVADAIVQIVSKQKYIDIGHPEGITVMRETC